MDLKDIKLINQLFSLKDENYKYTYNVGYCSCEEAPTVQLTHKNLFSDEELEDLVQDAIIEVLKIEKNKEKSLAICDNGTLANFSIIMEEVINYLVNKNGFKKLVYNAQCINIYGDSNLFQKYDWSSYRQRNDFISRLYEKIKKVEELKKEVEFGKERDLKIIEDRSEHLFEDDWE